MSAFLLLAAGSVIGWLGSRLADAQITECPTCAIEDNERQVLMEICAQRRQAESQMRGAAESSQYHARHSQPQGADDLAGWAP